ncbi:MAG: 2-phospho-L-lactate guanylyltransferase [Acidobacteriaceae bacterium]
MILIPIKNLGHAKQRLAEVLTQEARTQLARAMLLDILETLSQWQGRPEVSLVSGDPSATEMARHFNFDVITDLRNTGESDAIAMATAVCETRGAKSTLVIPGDIPLLQASELAAILESAPAQGSVLVPAADGRGTNAIFRSPCGLFPLRFGNDSFFPHHAKAIATQKPCIVMNFPGVAMDIDNPPDLQDLANAPGERRSQLLVRKWNFAELPRTANA